ncbi:hypothetical protein BJ508DRAFT_374785 [Ascobolus immersus RN42]|uniref:Uncharacterized protein n=1 Tax=Ascobolus immersus RN42 TaxID=1160509 RepID=A0A3N4II72_ASCIM|nr:hypothetical protein BJ508DRAFT_374785 [Ascobolus immersus RN42]
MSNTPTTPSSLRLSPDEGKRDSTALPHPPSPYHNPPTPSSFSFAPPPDLSPSLSPYAPLPPIPLASPSAALPPLPPPPPVELPAEPIPLEMAAEPVPIRSELPAEPVPIELPSAPHSTNSSRVSPVSPNDYLSQTLLHGDAAPIGFDRPGVSRSTSHSGYLQRGSIVASSASSSSRGSRPPVSGSNGVRRNASYAGHLRADKNKPLPRIVTNGNTGVESEGWRPSPVSGSSVGGGGIQLDRRVSGMRRSLTGAGRIGAGAGGLGLDEGERMLPARRETREKVRVQEGDDEEEGGGCCGFLFGRKKR